MVVYQDQASCHLKTETNSDIDKHTQIDDAEKYVKVFDLIKDTCC